MSWFKRNRNSNRRGEDVLSLEYCLTIYKAHGARALHSHIDAQFTTEDLARLCRELDIPLTQGTMNNIMNTIIVYARDH